MPDNPVLKRVDTAAVAFKVYSLRLSEAEQQEINRDAEQFVRALFKEERGEETKAVLMSTNPSAADASAGEVWHILYPAPSYCVKIVK